MYEHRGYDPYWIITYITVSAALRVKEIVNSLLDINKLWDVGERCTAVKVCQRVPSTLLDT